MKELLNMYVIWLIVIALPLQGLAAATMISCAQLQSQSIDHQAHNHNHNHEHEHEHEHHSMKDIHSHTQTNGSNLHADSSKHTCNQCAKCSTCCSGFTFTTASVSTLLYISTSMGAIEFASPLFASHIPSSPERPPRLTLI